MPLSILVVLLVAPLVTAGRGDYCKEHLLDNNSTLMQFNKELIDSEYAVLNQFKAIHCCGKGYRSIEWLKDGVAYPWASGVSNLILYPEAANQTLYTQRAGHRDSGNYTCRMRNDTHLLDHTVALHVSEMATNTPQATVVPNDKIAAVGSAVRFYCEAFVGRVNLPDAHTDIKWRRVRPDEERRERARPAERLDDDRADVAAYNFKEILTKRESEDIVGAYLYIGRVLPEDYGQYVCTARSNDVVREMRVALHFADSLQEDASPREAPWRSLMVGAAVVCAVLLSAGVLCARWGPRLALAATRLASEQARPLSEHECDVLVVCTAVDGELTRGALLPTLAHHYHYRADHLQLTTTPDSWYEQVMERAQYCRSLVCVMSPAQHSQAQLLTALKQLRAVPVPLVIVLLQDLPKLKRSAKDEHGESLVSLLRRSKLLAWRHVQDRAFWTSLRLALRPPAPRCPPAASQAHADPLDKASEAGVGMVEFARDQSSRSGSLTALV